MIICLEHKCLILSYKTILVSLVYGLIISVKGVCFRIISIPEIILAIILLISLTPCVRQYLHEPALLRPDESSVTHTTKRLVYILISHKIMTILAKQRHGLFMIIDPTGRHGILKINYSLISRHKI